MAARTKQFEENSLYTWEIENYSKLTRELASPQFYIFDSFRWELVLRPGVFHNFQEQDVVYIRRITPSSTLEHRISAKVWIQDKDGERRHEKIQEDIYVAEGWNYLIWSIDKQVLEREKDDIVRDDCMVIQCRLGTRFNSQSNAIESEILLRTKSPREKLVSDLSYLFESAENFDVSLKCGEATLSAHRCILAARSEVFSAMFRHEMVEKNKGVVAIEDIEYDDLYKLLRYIYTCKLDGLDTEIAVRLYEIADRYAVETLKEECSLYLQKHLSTTNACDILLMADSHGDTSLKSFVICFLVRNKKFLMSPPWKKFCKQQSILCNEVFLSFVEVSNDWEDFGVVLS